MEAKRRALGRGLGALLPAGPAAAEGREEDTGAPVDAQVGVDRITPNPYQPRRTFSDEALDELAASIREQGLLQPLLVRPHGDSYQLIAGERRLRAAQRAGLERVPVLVREADDRELLELALIENLQREDLDPIEEARSYERLADEFGLPHDEIARAVGKQRSTVSNSLRLLQLPEDVQQRLSRGELSAGHARGLLALPAAERSAAARDVVERKLSVRETEKMSRSRRPPAPPDADVAAVETELSQHLGTRVRLRERTGGRGRIEIEYYSLDELNGLIDRLRGSRTAAVGF